MPKVTGQKNALTPKSEPLIIELLIKFKEQGLTLKEQVPAFRELGYGISSVSTLQNWRRKFGLTEQKYANTGEIKGNQNLGFIEDEVWKPIITNTFDASEYQISQYGNVLSKKGQKMRWQTIGEGYMGVKMSLTKNNYTSDYTPSNDRGSTSAAKRIGQAIQVHKIVAELFLPKPVPLCFSQLWPTLDKKQRDWIQSVYIVDHIDNDRSNPHVDNLRWVTGRQNNKWVKAANNED